MLETDHSEEQDNLEKVSLISGETDLKTRWLTPGELRPVLRSISYAWFRYMLRPPSEHLGIIRRGVWEAECGLQPYPDVAVAYKESLVAGVLSGYRMYSKKHFLIENMALHPGFLPTELEDGMLVAQALITAAIDLSVDMGCYGWLATSPDEDSRAFWRNLGFYKYDEFSYRKMGYFQS